jgi:dTDP-4-amino-4,6-dideoxygalactose transaminase
MYRIGMEELAEVEKVINSKRLFRVGSELHEVETFEQEWAEKIGTEHCVFVSGGTPALICGLAGFGIGPGDEVIVPGYTFMATASAVLAVGAIPVIADIDESLTIDPDDIERKISPYTRAIIPVHINGCPCDMDRIMAIARKHNILVLEDACQADGGSFKGKRLGSIGDAGAFSFNHFKIISCGEGGALVTNNRKIFERVLIYHDSGTAFRPYMKELSEPVFLGAQYRVGEISGAVMRIQLQRLDGILEDLRRVKRRVVEGLESVANNKYIKYNDPEGECAVVVAFQFEDEAKAKAFSVSEGVKGTVLINSDKHVYANWEPILSKRGSHHPALNPFNLPQNKDLNMNYSKDMCPRTLDILKRTVIVFINPDWTNEQTDACAEACRKGFENL